MKAVQITLEGCDSYTSVIIIVTDEQLAILEKLAELTKAESKISCQPTLSIVVKDES